MDQIIAVFGINWKLLLIQGINFAVVLFVLHRYLYRPVLKMLADRQEKIAKGVKDAEEANAALGTARGEARVLVEAAEREARDTELMAKKSAEDTAARILSEADQKKAREVENLKREAEEMKRKAIAESQNEIAKLAILAAEKILKKS
jgi:F-type H+-transporting ATPase subunit b